ncbi:MAG TPA: hypothetical protein PLT26_15270 [Anaerolineaceae bacterium]|nr:hypothetical protein [Anaerolineaceae bacterium]HQH86886.1 hypothetical protein [Anaerolineaceae bacterium]
MANSTHKLTMKIKFSITTLILFLLLLTSCAINPTDSATIPVGSPSPTATEFTLPSPTPSMEPTQIPGCKWPPTQITTEVYSFQWSEDGDSLYFIKNGEDQTGEAYSVSTGQTVSGISAESIVEPYLDVITSLRKIADVYGIEKPYDDIFVSPQGDFAAFTRSAYDGGSTYGLYLKRKGEGATQFIGNIQGIVDRHTWISQGTQLILSINYYLKPGAPEAYVYLVDFDTQEIQILVPQTDAYDDTWYSGVTPDETKLLITAFGRGIHLLRTWDIAELKEEPTSIIDPLTYKNIPGTNQILALGYTAGNNEYPTLYIYDFDTGVVQSLSTLSMQIGHSINSVKISPSLKYIAYVDYNDFALYLIDCSTVMP